jgi:hypothetical protein
VTRTRVLGTRIAEADDEFECVPGHLELAVPKKRGATIDRRAA